MLLLLPSKGIETVNQQQQAYIYKKLCKAKVHASLVNTYLTYLWIPIDSYYRHVVITSLFLSRHACRE